MTSPLKLKCDIRVVHAMTSHVNPETKRLSHIRLPILIASKLDVCKIQSWLWGPKEAEYFWWCKIFLIENIGIIFIPPHPNPVALEANSFSFCCQLVPPFMDRIVNLRKVQCYEMNLIRFCSDGLMRKGNVFLISSLLSPELHSEYNGITMLCRRSVLVDDEYAIEEK